jgi:hypothetical protein
MTFQGRWGGGVLLEPTPVAQIQKSFLRRFFSKKRLLA